VHIFSDDLDDSAMEEPAFADGIEIGFEKRRRLGVGTKEGLARAFGPIPIGAVDLCGPILHERATISTGAMILRAMAQPRRAWQFRRADDGRRRDGRGFPYFASQVKSAWPGR